MMRPRPHPPPGECPGACGRKPDGIDWVTQDIVIQILHEEEEGHRRLFEGFLREYEAEGLA